MPLSPSFIKEIAFRADPSYILDNTPFPLHSKRPFLGREQIKRKFLGFLCNREKKRGTFLVTGYRGMGKTSFVNHTLSEYIEMQKDSGKKIIPINISLAQSKPREIDILRLLVSKIYDAYINPYKGPYGGPHQPDSCPSPYTIYKKKINAQKINKMVLLLALLSLAFPALVIIKPTLIQSFITNRYTPLASTNEMGLSVIKWCTYVFMLIWLAIVAGTGIRAWSIRKSIIEIDDDESNPLNIIQLLYKRCFASIEKETSHKSELSLEIINKFVTGSHKRINMVYPIAESKEIEYALSRFLEEASKNYEFIFIFDELDKVDPAITPSYLYEDNNSNGIAGGEVSYQKDLRDRKQAIINVIAGLKNFLTTAEARFIFIAGREMFDASLADISDRQSSISSIFTYVFYVESFLREKKESLSMSSVIEEYISILLFGFTSYDDLRVNLFQRVSLEMRVLPELTEEETKLAMAKLILILQSFVIYLTYRSGGSPKKLIKTVQEFIRAESEGHNYPEKVLVGENTNRAKTKEKHDLYLYLDYHNQYRIGFINYLYRPFLIRYGSSFKQFSDNIIVSTPYLFDHLLKFHPYSFSITNLELVPEVLSTNKTPMLREHIQQIISYLGNNHIRETEIGLSDYKFYSRTYNEIVFLCRNFEEESAAFNFTLDEGHLVKLHVGNKLKELRHSYEKFAPGSEKQQIFSISHLNGVLGDLHFFDQEFDDAIVAYADAIRTINHLDVGTMNIRDFVTLIRYKLKLGLCFEKIKSYEEALAFYSDSSQDAKRFILSQISYGKHVDPKNERLLARSFQGETSRPAIFHSSTLSDLLQIVNQCFLAKIIIEEKMGIEGISAPKIAIAFGSFLNLAEGIARHCGRNHLILANAYSVLGNLFYYKNSHFGAGYSAELQAGLPEKVALRKKELFKHYREFFGNDDQKRKPLLSLVYYLLGLNEVLTDRDVMPLFYEDLIKYKNPAFFLIQTYRIRKDKQRFVSTHNKYIGTFLSNIGDCLLCMYDLNDVPGKNDAPHKDDVQHKKYLLSEFFNIERIINSGKTSDPDDRKSSDPFGTFLYYLKETNAGERHLVDVIRLYYIAGEYFEKMGRTVSRSFQYRKILRVFRLVLKDPEEGSKYTGEVIKILDLLKEFILSPILQISGQNSDFGDMHMTKKMTDLGISQQVALVNGSNHSESQEALLLYSYILLKVGTPFRKIPIGTLISSYNSFSSQYTRILEHDFYSKYCYLKFKRIQHCSRIRESIKKWNCIRKLAVDYLFSMTSIVRILKIYGMDYSMGFSYCAFTHLRIAKFLCIMNQLNEKNDPGLVEYMKNGVHYMLGDKSRSILDEQYHFQMAREYYEKAIQLHTAGSEYKSLIGSLIYLEDDINDNAYHFGAALDRYMMMNGLFHKNRQECMNMVKDSIYQFEAYIDPDTQSRNPGSFIGQEVGKPQMNL